MTIFLLIPSPDRCFSPNTGLQRDWGPLPGELSSCYSNRRYINALCQLQCFNIDTLGPSPPSPDKGRSTTESFSADCMTLSLTHVDYSEIKARVWHCTFDGVTLSSLSWLLRREKRINGQILFFDYEPAWSHVVRTKIRIETIHHLLEILHFCCFSIWNNGRSVSGFFLQEVANNW